MPSRRSLRWMQFVLSAPKFWECVQETFSGTTVTGNSEQRRHGKERSSRCTDQTHSRKRTAPSPHYIQLHFVIKRSRDQPQKRWHPSVVSLSIASIAFHAARSAPPTYLNQTHQVKLCLLIHTPTAGRKPILPWYQSWQQRDGSFRSGALGIQKKKKVWSKRWLARSLASLHQLEDPSTALIRQVQKHPRVEAIHSNAHCGPAHPHNGATDLPPKLKLPPSPLLERLGPPVSAWAIQQT